MARSGLNAVPKSSSRACPAAPRSVTEEMYEYAQWLLGTSLYDLARAGTARASSVAAESAVRVRMWRRMRREVMSRTAIGVSAGGLSAAGACPAGPATSSPPVPPFPCAKRRG